MHTHSWFNHFRKVHHRSVCLAMELITNLQLSMYSHVTGELEKRDVTVVNVAADGDPRLLRAMILKLYLTTIKLTKKF